MHNRCKQDSMRLGTCEHRASRTPFQEEDIDCRPAHLKAYGSDSTPAPIAELHIVNTLDTLDAPESSSSSRSSSSSPPLDVMFTGCASSGLDLLTVPGMDDVGSSADSVRCGTGSAAASGDAPFVLLDAPMVPVH
jgi:hypothetical protein